MEPVLTLFAIAVVALFILNIVNIGIWREQMKINSQQSELNKIQSELNELHLELSKLLEAALEDAKIDDDEAQS